MSKYVISGYYGFGNAGDEAILQAIINSLLKEDEKAQITVFSSNPQLTAAEHGVAAAHRTNLRQVGAALKAADLFISGGGGLLQDATSSRSLLYYLGLLVLARRLGCKTMVYANSIGPIAGRRNRRLTRAVLNKTDYITVRDQLSLDLLKELGVNKPPLRLTADPVLLLPGPGGEAAPGRIIMAVREWPSSHNYLEAILFAAKKLAEEGFSLQFIPFHYHRDLAVAQSLAAAVGEGALGLQQPLGYEELLRRLQEAQVVVAMRLHALVMGAVCGRPLVGISYDPKIEGFLQTVGQPLAGTTANLDGEQLYLQIRQAYEERKKRGKDLKQRLLVLRRLAAESALIAARLAGGDRDARI